jgi:hypothetical protein
MRIRRRDNLILKHDPSQKSFFLKLYQYLMLLSGKKKDLENFVVENLKFLWSRFYLFFVSKIVERLIWFTDEAHNQFYYSWKEK